MFLCVVCRCYVCACVICVCVYVCIMVCRWYVRVCGVCVCVWLACVVSMYMSGVCHGVHVCMCGKCGIWCMCVCVSCGACLYVWSVWHVVHVCICVTCSMWSMCVCVVLVARGVCVGWELAWEPTLSCEFRIHLRTLLLFYFNGRTAGSQAPFCPCCFPTWTYCAQRPCHSTGVL